MPAVAWNEMHVKQAILSFTKTSGMQLGHRCDQHSLQCLAPSCEQAGHVSQVLSTVEAEASSIAHANRLTPFK